MNKNSKFFNVGVTLVILVIGFIFGKIESIKHTAAVETTTTQQDPNNVFSLEKRENSYVKPFAFINPLLDCADLNNISDKDVEAMQKSIRDFIDEQKAQGVDDASVYFHDLDNGPSFGIKAMSGFFPASLLKVPLMLSVLDQAMTDPGLLNKKFVYQGGSRNNEYFRAAKELENNHTYTIDEALTSMIKYSDNNASHALSYAVSTDTLMAGYQDLGVPLPDEPDYAISAETYSSFFEILYNSTFLSKAYSEKALRLLSETNFNQGLVAGVPSSSIKIAHKFGERQVNATTKQLHDCGIIYYPGRPYLLCVMTKGSDFDQLASFISQISRKVYDAIDQEKN